MPIIKTENLDYVYGENTPFEVKALSNINIEIKKGDFVAVIGHTGSGKSTLIQLLNGIHKPTKGKVFFKDEDIFKNAKTTAAVKFKVGMVFQYPEYQLFEETVYKDIAFGPGNMGLSETQIKDRVLIAARAVGLPEYILEKSPFDLSGGEKRRAAIAGVIAMQPEVLVLDEPTAGLDPKGRQRILSLIKDYHRNGGKTVIFVSHSMEDVANIADKTIVMDRAQVLMFDETRKIFAQEEKLIELGLQIPQITKVMLTLRRRGYPFSKGILTVDKAVAEIKQYIANRGGQQSSEI